jgi:hypothetical protein
MAIQAASRLTINREPAMRCVAPAALICLSLVALTSAGCVHVREPAAAPAVTSAAAPKAVAPAAAPPAAAAAPARVTGAGGTATTPAPKVAAAGSGDVRPATPAPGKPAASAAAAGPKAGAAPVAAASKPAAAAPKPPAAATLDLATLEQRLRETRSIGVFAKLSLKNQVDDLLDQTRAYYRAQGKPPPTALRQRYEGLLLKVIALLQDGDAPLAAAIATSREAIWSILADPDKLSKI